LYKGSPAKAVMALYPEHDWKPWKFTATPRNWWIVKDNQRVFIQHLRSQMNLGEGMDELYKVTKQDIEKAGGMCAVARRVCGSLTKC